MLKTRILCLGVAAVSILSGCAPDPKSIPVEQELKLTYGGFLDGGDEHQKVSGVCKPDAMRDAMSCDIYNGLPNWRLTEVDIRVTWTPYGQDNVRDFKTGVSISPQTTTNTDFKLGTRLPDDTTIHGHPITHWSWIIIAAKGTPE